MDKIKKFLEGNKIKYIVSEVGKNNDQLNNYKKNKYGRVKNVDLTFVSYDDEFENEKIYIRKKEEKNGYIPELRIMKYNDCELYYIRNNGEILDYVKYERALDIIEKFIEA